MTHMRSNLSFLVRVAGWWRGLYLHPLYWRIRAGVARASFLLGKAAYVSSRSIRERRAGASTAYGLGRIALLQALLAGLAMAVVAIGEWRICEWTTLCTWPPVTAQSSAGLTTFLATVAQVTAALLGLYFTGLSVIASTAYANVSPTIRELLLDERQGRVYLRLTAFTGAYAIWMVAVTVFDVPLGRVNVALIATLCVLSLLSFVMLGRRAFRLFDPAELALAQIGEVRHEIRAAARSTLVAKEPSLQNHHRRMAENRIALVADVLALSERTRHSTARIATHLLALLLFYSKHRPDIPTDSLWFRVEQRFQPWLLADSSRVELALNTGVELFPERTQNVSWFEDDLIEGLRLVLRLLLDRGDTDRAVDVVSAAQDVCLHLPEAFQTQDALKVADCFASVLDHPSLSLPQATVSSRQSLGLFEALCRPVTWMLIGAIRSLEAISDESLRVATLRCGDRPGSPLREAYPLEILQRITFLRQAIDFERDVERSRVTSDLYVANAMRESAASYCAGVTSSCVAVCERFYPVACRQLLTAGRVDEAGLVLSVARDASRKLGALLEKANDRWNLLRDSALPSAVEDWPDFDRGGLDQRLSAFRTQLIDLQVALVPKIPTTKRPADAPDIHGMAHTVLTEEAWEALMDGDDPRFRRVFPSVVLMAIGARERVFTEVDASQGETRLLVIGDLLSDLSGLTGLAYLHSAIYGSGVWESVTKILERIPSTREWLSFWLSATEMRDEDPRSSARSLMRTRWVHEFDAKLRRDGIAHDTIVRPEGAVVRCVIDPLAASYVRSSFVDPSTVFFAALVRKNGEALNVVGRRLPEFQKDVERLLEEREEAKSDPERYWRHRSPSTGEYDPSVRFWTSDV